MGATKRDAEGASPAGDDRRKKPRKGDDETARPTFQSIAGKMDGPDDKFVKGLFTALHFAILTFALDLFKARPYRLPRKREHKELFEALTGSDINDYLTSKHPNAKQSIVRAVIWKKLVDSLLDSPLNAFLPMSETRLYNDRSTFYSLRAIIAQYIVADFDDSADWGDGGKLRKTFVDETVELLSNLANMEDQDDLRTGLDDIADKAYQLARAMASSGACWDCTMQAPDIDRLHGYKIKTDWMEPVKIWKCQQGQRPTVDLVVRPMLLKFSNCSGREFKSCQVVKKALVVERDPRD